MNRDDGSHRFGIFYANRDDPALVVPKRYGPGRTLNYGHPLAWIWTCGAPIAVGVPVYLSEC